jgi:hypothetical protein
MLFSIFVWFLSEALCALPVHFVYFPFSLGMFSFHSWCFYIIVSGLQKTHTYILFL